jgi:hypothetical protein
MNPGVRKTVADPLLDSLICDCVSSGQQGDDEYEEMGRPSTLSRGFTLRADSYQSFSGIGCTNANINSASINAPMTQKMINIFRN